MKYFFIFLIFLCQVGTASPGNNTFRYLGDSSDEPILLPAEKVCALALESGGSNEVAVSGHQLLKIIRKMAGWRGFRNVATTNNSDLVAYTGTWKETALTPFTYEDKPIFLRPDSNKSELRSRLFELYQRTQGVSFGKEKFLKYVRLEGGAIDTWSDELQNGMRLTTPEERQSLSNSVGNISSKIIEWKAWKKNAAVITGVIAILGAAPLTAVIAPHGSSVNAAATAISLGEMVLFAFGGFFNGVMARPVHYVGTSGTASNFNDGSPSSIDRITVLPQQAELAFRLISLPEAAANAYVSIRLTDGKKLDAIFEKSSNVLHLIYWE